MGYELWGEEGQSAREYLLWLGGVLAVMAALSRVRWQ